MKSVLLVPVFLFSAFASFSQSLREISEGVLVRFHAEGDSVTIRVLAVSAGELGFADHSCMGGLDIMDAAADTSVDDVPYTGFAPDEMRDPVCITSVLEGKPEDFYVRFSFVYFGTPYEIDIFYDGRRTWEQK